MTNDLIFLSGLFVIFVICVCTIILGYQARDSRRETLAAICKSKVELLGAIAMAESVILAAIRKPDSPSPNNYITMPSVADFNEIVNAAKARGAPVVPDNAAEKGFYRVRLKGAEEWTVGRNDGSGCLPWTVIGDDRLFQDADLEISGKVKDE